MRVLFLSYYFPPMGGVGVQRALKFVKYMPGFGVDATVIAADDPNYVSDAKLLNQLPVQTPIIRLSHSTLLNKILAWRRGKEDNNSHAPRAPQQTIKSGGQLKLNTTIRDFVLRHYAALQFPDDKRSWGQLAYQAALKAHVDKPFDLILSTSPPITSLFVAARLKKQLGIPWIADFRDLWTKNESYNMPVWRKWLDVISERQLLKQADGIVTVTEGFATSLRRMTPVNIPVEVIPNGYDDADFADLVSVDKATERFLLIYTGTLYGKRTPLPFLQGLEQLLESKPQFAEKICVRFIGNIGSRFEPLISAFEQRFPGIIERKAFVSHDMVPAMLKSADALLMILGGENADSVLPAKVFEYLRATRPILFVGPAHSESARLIKETGHGLTCDEHHPEQISQALNELVQGNFNLADGTIIAKYERRHLTGQLVKFLRDVGHVRQ